MIKTTIEMLDETVMAIKNKNENDSFNPQGLKKFELCFFVSLDIVRFELQTEMRISDETGGVLSFLFTFRCFEYYYRDYSEVYSKTSQLFTEFTMYNEKLRNNELSFAGHIKENWIQYFNGRLSSYIG